MLMIIKVPKTIVLIPRVFYCVIYLFPGPPTVISADVYALSIGPIIEVDMVSYYLNN